MEGKSLNITEEKINQLKEILPEAFTEDKIDWEKLKAALGDNIEFKNERYVLNWAGKSDAFRALQTPSTATLVPSKEESVNFDESENIFIEGENLEVLKVLQKSYFSKIKMIYIDPPYNTGNDNFIYPDRFAESREEYLSRIGDKDETGLMTREGLFRKNSKDSGHYHSNWLSMMFPRLFLARNLLRDDGVIFVSIDDNEVHNLRLLMNEVFGEENFVESFIWRSRLGKGATSEVTATLHEYILSYCKNINNLELAGDIRTTSGEKKERIRQWGQGDRREDRPTMFYPVESNEFGTILPIKPDGTEGRWRVRKDKFEEMQAKNLVVFEKQTDGRIEAYRIIPEGTITETAQDSILNSEIVKTTAHGSKEINNLFGFKIFDYPKPSNLLIHFTDLVTTNSDIILDFFAGSCTTAHAVLSLNKEDGGNRKFICVQLLEKCEENSEAFKAGYKTIAEIGKERIRRVIKKIREEREGKLDFEDKGDKDLGFKVFKLQESNFKIWRTNIETEEELVAQMQQHLEPLDENAKIEDVLYELLLKSGVSLTAKIKNKKDFILVNGDEVALMLEKADEKIIKQILAVKPKKVFTLDRLFKDNDKLKTNTALQMKDAGIEFKVI